MKQNPTFTEFARARLSVIQLEIASLPDRPEFRAQIKRLRSNEDYMEAGLAVYQDYVDEMAFAARETS